MSDSALEIHGEIKGVQAKRKQAMRKCKSVTFKYENQEERTVMKKAL